ncbi:hypothetical protein [Archaeoglobus veneficus]|uniref:Uncharacterized protein n=1 Tax=Archaeoglobus veneficus (strain DSM 11195 / SNP6) TaxID=693661 RepID=F2KPA7_ARCVS|nr:hypothetical protein [Archaeoglobus veneficus]AEA47511.1 hypothetical protein Arcve_1509 [Archaeoglobus veneficus SNP6]
MRRLAIALIALFVLIHPALALEKLNASDFKEPDVTVTINDVEYKPTLSDGKLVVDCVCEKGNSVEISYIIEPIDEDKAKDVDGRTYTARTELSGAIIKATVYYRNGGGVGYESTPGKTYLDIKVGDWEDGLDKISVTVQGTTPSPSSRLQELNALKFDIQEAAENCLPPVVLLVVDYTKFQNDIDSMKKQYDDLSAVLEAYIGKVDTSKLSDYLNYAGQNISLAETYYNDGEYVKADERLNYASEWLDKADTEAKKVKAEYACDQADKKLEDIGGILDTIDVYLSEIEEKNLVNTSTLLNYKTDFRGLQEKSSSLAEELAVAKAYISTGKYSEAEIKASNILNEANELESSANALLDKLKKVVSPAETATPESTSEPFKMPSIDYKLLGMAIGAIAAIAIAAVGIKKYMKRRKWDELK